MPTYEYNCATCGEMEVFQRMSDDALTSCPECGQVGLQKLVSGGAGVIFKGEGFHDTDYRSSDYKKDAAKDTEAVGCAGGGSCPAAEAGTSCPMAES